ncbi:MAG: cyclic nucleotide-binding domain-containing protein [Rhodocyclaceae bacterium]|nr:cyclic nucleotide-binding domain-containing protein [Rhodocyclaceae bacterium]MCL4760126.1 cyclic nucleotide-binding domain-containing protein [Rhodocyclaceae bacterium]
MNSAMIVLGVLNDGDIEWLVANGMRCSFQPGETLIEQGRHSRYMYLVLDGKVGFEREGLGRVGDAHHGELLGEISFLDAGPPTMTVRAEAVTTVLSVPRETMRTRLDSDDGFAARFYRALGLFMAQRLRTTQALVDALRAGRRFDVTQERLDLELIEHGEIAARRFRDILERLP